MRQLKRGENCSPYGVLQFCPSARTLIETGKQVVGQERKDTGKDKIHGVTLQVLWADPSWPPSNLLTPSSCDEKTHVSTQRQFDR